MFKIQEFHWHSILCHLPCGALPLSALLYWAGSTYNNKMFLFAHGVLVFISLFALGPVIVSGYISRASKHVNWSGTFIKKTVISALLFISCTIQATLITIELNVPMSGFYTVLSLFTTPILSLLLIILGHTITQGRFGGKTSYSSDPDNSLTFDVLEKAKKEQPNPLEEDHYGRI